MYDNVVVMSRCRVVYQGALADAETYFNLLGYHVPASKTLSDFLQSLALLPAMYHAPARAARALRERAAANGEDPVDGEEPTPASHLTLADGVSYARGGAEAPWPATSRPISYSEEDIDAVSAAAWPRARPLLTHLRRSSA